MSRIFSSIQFWKKAITSLVGLHFLAAVILAASPALHEKFHRDDGHQDHECAATLLVHGAVEATPVVPPALAPARVDYFELTLQPVPLLALVDLPGQCRGRAPPSAA